MYFFETGPKFIVSMLILFGIARVDGAQSSKNKISASQNKDSITEPQNKMKLQDLIAMAIERNPELIGLNAEAQSQGAKVGPAGALEDPMLSVQAMNIPKDNLRLDQDEMSGIQVGLLQKFPFPGKRSKVQEIAEIKSSASKKRLAQKQLNIIRDVKKAYYDLFLKLQRKQILASQRSFLRQLIAASRNQYALNKVPQSAVLNLQVDEATLIDEGLKIDSDIRDSQAELSHLVGHEKHLISTELEKQPMSKVNFDSWTEEKVAEAVETSSSELLALKSETDAGQAQVDLAKKGYLPDFEIMANYIFRKDLQGMPPKTQGSRDMVGAGIAMSLPLWADRKQSEQVKGAVADKAKAKADFDNTRLMLTHQARALFAQLKESKQRIELFEGGLLQLTAQIVAAGRSSYLTGRLDHANFLESLRKQQNSEYGYQEALAKFEVQLAGLEALMGQKLQEEKND